VTPCENHSDERRSVCLCTIRPLTDVVPSCGAKCSATCSIFLKLSRTLPLAYWLTDWLCVNIVRPIYFNVRSLESDFLEPGDVGRNETTMVQSADGFSLLNCTKCSMYDLYSKCSMYDLYSFAVHVMVFHIAGLSWTNLVSTNALVSTIWSCLSCAFRALTILL